MRAAVLVCYEDTLPEAGREAMEVAPNLLVNVTNDAWFFGSAESELHLRVATLRAVELRRDIVRAVNFGPTSWVDAAGRVRARALAGASRASSSAEPALLETAPTLYARFGDAPLGASPARPRQRAVWRAARRPLKCTTGAAPLVAAGRPSCTGRETEAAYWMRSFSALSAVARTFFVSRLALDGDRLLGERVDARAVLRGRLLDGVELQQARGSRTRRSACAAPS